LNFYTEWYWKSNLHNVFHFLALRLDAHAQWEIRQYAAKMGEIVKTVVPVAYKAFEDFTLNAARLSEKEQVAISKMLSGSTLSDACAFAGLELLRADGKPVKSGEGPEFVEKLDRINARASGFGK
ncbi:FAD-dependent thymidylate synthase, partial [Candidatus Marsarchaeota archaeon]|nr:FAD-dependent thymidylate synthase [Candidatus Marsarchaeota archaeon]